MKLPNGYGTCYRLPGNRRRPFVVKKTVNGRQKILGYFDTFEHGIAYLSSVNASPLLDDDITFSELFSRWKATKYDRISLSSRKSYDNAYRHCHKLHNMPFRRIRYGHLQDVVDEIQAGYCTQKKCRGLMEHLYKYAIKYDIVATDYARYVELKPHIRKYKKKPFTVRQRNKLWRAVDTLPAVQDVLILIYTGLRIGEYLRLTPQDVKWRSHYFIVRQSKTAAGQGDDPGQSRYDDADAAPAARKLEAHAVQRIGPVPDQPAISPLIQLQDRSNLGHHFGHCCYLCNTEFGTSDYLCPVD